jgi:hypothetical protein
MPRQERQVTAIQPDRVAFFRSLMEAEGFTVTAQANADGTTNLFGERDIAEPEPVGGGDALQKIAWGKKVSAEFKQKVLECCGRLGVNPDFLMSAMAFETGETFDPKAHNASTGATGLIQFLPSTAIGLEPPSRR